MEKLEQNINKIKKMTAQLRNREDLLLLIHEAQKLLKTDHNYLISIEDLNRYIIEENTNKSYNKFLVNKKSGGTRQINAPEIKLLYLQQALSLILQCVFQPHPAAHGFIWNHSIVDNAKKHVGKRYVYNIDLKDFFSTVNQTSIWRCLLLRPYLKSSQYSGERNSKFSDLLGCVEYNQWKDRFGLAEIIAIISCTELDVEVQDENGQMKIIKSRVLPQGAPTSPVLTNIVCQQLDRRLTGVANRFGLVYTRYADDITFSSMHNVYRPGSEFIKELNRVIANEGFTIKTSKTRLQKQGYRQEVTGLAVNEKVNVSRRYVKNIRMWLYYWERWGYKRAAEIFIQDYQEDRSHAKKKWKHAKLMNVLGGKIEYLGMVKGKDNNTYKQLKMRYDRLVGTHNKVNRVLKTWEINGIDAAISLFENIQ